MTHDLQLWCEDCQTSQEGDCQKHGPLKIVADTEVSTRARRSIPHILQLKEEASRTGVFAKTLLSKRLQFGPLQAKRISACNQQLDVEEKIKERFGVVFKIVQKEGDCLLLDTQQEELSNWMIFVRPAEKKAEQNLVAFQYKGEIYFATIKEISAQCELKVWYSKDYAERMGTRILAEEGVSWQFRTRQRFRCRGCEVVFSSAASLNNHRCVRTNETPKSEAISSRGRQGKKGSSRSGEPVTPVASTSGKKTVARKGLQQQQQPTSGKPLSKLKVDVDSSEESSDSDQLDILSSSPQRRSPRSSPRGRSSVYACDVCKKVFLSPGKLKQHSYSHTGERPFSCTLCLKAFSSRFKLVRHQLIHTTERQHQCPRCERSFHRKDHLKNHIQIHEPNKQFKCEKVDCGKEYNSYMSYRKHCAVHAAEEGDLQCKICQKMFETKPDLIYHLKVHVGSRSVKSPSEKKFQCDHCDRRFFTRKDVKRHLVVHTGKRDFTCTICPQRFGRKDHLVRHIKKSHGIADLSRMEGLDYSATPSSATQAFSPDVSVASSPPSTSSSHPVAMEVLPEPVAGPSGLSGSAGLLEQGETQFITPFQQEKLEFEFAEVVKEEPELQPSMVEMSPGGDDLSKILGMYLPSGSINLPGPSLLDPASSRSDEGESQHSHMEPVMLTPEERKESALQRFPQESTGSRGLIAASPREEYGPEGIMSAGLMSSESSGVSTRSWHSPGSVSQLSGNGISVDTTTTATVPGAAGTAATFTASSVAVTRAASQFPSLPGFDEVFPS